MLNGGGFHVRALDPASADDLRTRVAGDGNVDDMSSSSSRISGCCGRATAGASAGGGGCSRPWAGPDWQRGNLQEKRKIRLVQVPPIEDDSGSSSGRCNQVKGRDAATCGAAGSGYDECEIASSGGEDPTRLSAPATKARGGGLIRRFSADTEAGKREGEGGGGSWGYKAEGLGKILAFVARRRDGGDGGGGGSVSG